MSRLRALLFVSLVVNLFAFGILAGVLAVAWRHGVRFAGEHPAATALPARPLFEAGAGLPPADRDRFVEALRAVNRANRPLRRDALENRRMAAVLFEAPVFDRDAAAAALDRARTDDFLLRERLEQAALLFAATLPPEERVLLARALARGGPLRHPHP